MKPTAETQKGMVRALALAEAARNILDEANANVEKCNEALGQAMKAVIKASPFQRGDWVVYNGSRAAQQPDNQFLVYTVEVSGESWWYTLTRATEDGKMPGELRQPEWANLEELEPVPVPTAAELKANFETDVRDYFQKLNASEEVIKKVLALIKSDAETDQGMIFDRVGPAHHAAVAAFIDRYREIIDVSGQEAMDELDAARQRAYDPIENHSSVVSGLD